MNNKRDDVLSTALGLLKDLLREDQPQEIRPHVDKPHVDQAHQDQSYERRQTGRISGGKTKFTTIWSVK